MVWTAGCWLGAALAVACSPGEFECQDDSMCGRSGSCEPNGFCSFFDPDCPSGWRYGEHAAPSLASTCVVPPTQTDGETESPPPVETTDASSSTGAFDPGSSSETTDEPVVDAGGSTTESESGVEVDGERIELPEGWDAGVWFDFSDAFTFDPAAFPDPPSTTYSNLPQNLFVLPDAFPGELGIVTAHTLIELGEEYAERNFYDITGAGPYAMWQGVDCSGLNAMPAAVCVGAGALGANGDGVFVVDPSWTMSALSSLNNSNALGFDPAGLFDGVGEPTLYIGTPSNLMRYPADPILGSSLRPRQVLVDGSFAMIRDNLEVGLQQLVVFASSVREPSVFKNQPLPEVVLSAQNPGALEIVTGDPAAFGGYLHAIVDTHRLVEFGADGAETELAESDPQRGWRWASAVVPPLSHPLADGRTTFYVLESNRDLDVDRVIWIRPPL